MLWEICGRGTRQPGRTKEYLMMIATALVIQLNTRAKDKMS